MNLWDVGVKTVSTNAYGGVASRSWGYNKMWNFNAVNRIVGSSYDVKSPGTIRWWHDNNTNDTKIATWKTNMASIRKVFIYVEKLGEAWAGSMCIMGFWIGATGDAPPPDAPMPTEA